MFGTKNPELTGVAIGNVCAIIPIGLEPMLEYLRKYGRPTLRCDSDGWCATIDMHVTSTGTTFTIRSEFSTKQKQYSPLESVMELHKRIVETLAMYD